MQLRIGLDVHKYRHTYEEPGLNSNLGQAFNNTVIYCLVGGRLFLFFHAISADTTMVLPFSNEKAAD